jgi:cyanophycinase
MFLPIAHKTMMIKGKLLIIGGKEDKGDDGSLDMARLNKNFTEFQILRNLIPAKNKKGNKQIEIVTTASTIPDEVAKDYKNAFKKLGHTKVGFINIENRQQAQQEEYLERVKNAHSVLFSGGDQFRLSVILGGTTFIDAIYDRYIHDSSFIVAGTSAGAMTMSKTMLFEGSNLEAMLKGDVKTTLGFGFLDNCIIDTHFVKRGRIGRLVEAIITNPPCMGIGLGEDTALIISKGNEMICCGSGMVVIIDGDEVVHTNVAYAEPATPLCVENLKLHILANGNSFKLKEKAFIPSAEDLEREKTSKSKTLEKI